MNILAFDTATESCSVALMTDGALVAESTSTEKKTHSVRVLTMVNSLLEHQGLRLSDIDGFAATIGPGSFTGLRIGISTLKGLSAATHKPVVGISTLAALAHQCTVEAEIICPLLDARKGEVYYGLFRRVVPGLEVVLPESHAAPAEALAEINRPCVFVGDGAVKYRELIETRLGSKVIFAANREHTVRAGAVAALAYHRMLRQDIDDPAGLKPQYIRRSDAELGIT